jgi:hypothetical protein
MNRSADDWPWQCDMYGRTGLWYACARQDIPTIKSYFANTGFVRRATLEINRPDYYGVSPADAGQMGHALRRPFNQLLGLFGRLEDFLTKMDAALLLRDPIETDKMFAVLLPKLKIWLDRTLATKVVLDPQDHCPCLGQ